MDWEAFLSIVRKSAVGQYGQTFDKSAKLLQKYWGIIKRNSINSHHEGCGRHFC